MVSVPRVFVSNTNAYASPKPQTRQDKPYVTALSYYYHWQSAIRPAPRASICSGSIFLNFLVQKKSLG